MIDADRVPQMNRRRAASGRRRWLVTGVALLIAMRIVGAVWTNLLPEEAYYWMFAKHPALSYYDHPPMVAWTILPGVMVLGDTEIGVRLVGLVLGFASAGLVYALGRSWFSPSVGTWSAAVFLILPGFHLCGVMTTPDSPLLFFWLVVLVAVTAAMRSGRGAWWYLAGMGLGGAMLSKYTGIVLALCTALFLLVDRDRRGWFRRKEPYLGLLIAGVLFLPVVVWNARAGWVSFRFQTVGRMAAVPPSWSSVMEFVGFQLVMLTPAVLLGVVAAVWQSLRRPALRRSARWQFALCYSLPMFAVVCVYAFRTELKMNWLLPGYLSLLPGTVALGQAAVRLKGVGRKASGWRAVAISSLVMAYVVDVAVLLHLAFPLPGSPRVARVHPWRELGGLVEAIDEAMEHRFVESPFIIGDGKSAIASELAFYMREPGEEEWRYVTSQSVLGRPGLNYPYWSSPRDYVGRPAIYVTDDDDLSEFALLRRAFTFVGERRLLLDATWRRFGKRFFSVECHGYLGMPTVATTSAPRSRRETPGGNPDE